MGLAVSPNEGGDGRARLGAPAALGAGVKIASALELARALPRGNDGDLDRGVEVATMVHAAGYEDDVVAASLLQAVSEGTQPELKRIRARCGEEVADLVAVLTQDSRGESYDRRMAAQRARVARSDRVAAAIYAADQLARIRALTSAGRPPTRAEFRHYHRTAAALGRAFPQLPFVAEIRFELGGIEGTARPNARRADR
jgi:hypothetical protein